LFNADLALSVTMTTLSTILAILTLPVNLIIYTSLAYEADITQQLDWASLFTALAVVISAVCLGLYASYRSSSLHFNVIANRVSGIFRP
jgi:predicted Na+-dependent transporter